MAHNQHVDYSGEGEGYYCGAVAFQFDTLDTKASRVGASTISMGNEFQSLMVLGRKEEPLYWVLVVSRVSCLSWVRR